MSHASAFFSPWDPPPHHVEPPSDPGLVQRVAKLVEFAARNGPSFVEMMRERQRENPEYAFLHGGEGADYYRWALYCQLYNHPQDQPIPGQEVAATAGAVTVPLQQQPAEQPAAPAPAAAVDTSTVLATLPAEVSSGFSQVLALLTGSRDSIRASQQWFMACAPYAEGMAEMMLQAVNSSSDYAKQQHIIYLANDILFKALAQRPQQAQQAGAEGAGAAADAAAGPENDAVAQAFKSRLGRMLAKAYETGGKTDQVQQGLARVVNFWAERGVYDHPTVEQFTMEMLGISLSPQQPQQQVPAAAAGQQVQQQMQQPAASSEPPAAAPADPVAAAVAAAKAAALAAAAAINKAVGIGAPAQPPQPLQQQAPQQAPIPMVRATQLSGQAAQQPQQGSYPPPQHPGHYPSPDPQQQWQQQHHPQWQQYPPPQQGQQGEYPGQPYPYPQQQQQGFPPPAYPMGGQQGQYPQQQGYPTPPGAPYYAPPPGGPHASYPPPPGAGSYAPPPHGGMPQQYPPPPQQQQTAQQGQPGSYPPPPGPGGYYPPPGAPPAAYPPPHAQGGPPPGSGGVPYYPPPPAPPPAKEPSPEPEKEPFDPMSFPPGLIPRLVEELSKTDAPYSPLSPLDIEKTGVPTAPNLDAYLKSRIDKFYAQLQDYRPGSLFSDIEVDVPRRKHFNDTAREEGPHHAGTAPGAPFDDGSAPGLGNGGRAAGLGYSSARSEDREVETGPGLGLGASEGGRASDVFAAYRNQRSRGYHDMIIRSAASKYG